MWKITNAPAPPELPGRISPSLIPHFRWGVHQWFSAPAGGSGWYYHRYHPTAWKDELREADRVDPMLRDLCISLSAHGILTTPSCQGHNHPQPWFRKAWEGLRAEEEQIRTHGLRLRNAASGEPMDYMNPAFALPWPTFERFEAEASRNQHVGYLGLLVPDSALAFASALESLRYESAHSSIGFDRGLSRAMEMPCFAVYVFERDETFRARRWREISNRLSESLLSRAA